MLRAALVPLVVSLALVALVGWLPAPSRAQGPAEPRAASTASTTTASAATIVPFDINTATLEQLDSLPGIGPSKAAAILEARERRPFRRLQDLLRVPGIGRSTLARLAPYLRFDPPPRAAPGSRTPSSQTAAR